MAWIDSAIEFVSPSWALRREASRAALGAWREHGASYRGGISGRLGTAFDRSPQITGQRIGDRYALMSMRDRSRSVDQNNPIGQGMLNRIVDNVVGEGMTLQCKTASGAFNAEAEERFEEWFDNADIRGMLTGAELQRQVVRAHERDGDVGIVLVDRGGKSRLQLVTGDQIFTPDGTAESPTMAGGVEMDRVGKPIRYHLLESPEFGKREFKAVPADYFIFYPRFKRFDAVRGEPCFSTAFTLLDQIDGYIDAVIVAARMAAIFGLIFKESGGPKQLSSLGFAANSKGDQQRAITLENGIARFIGKDDDVVQVQAQQPMSQTPDFVAAMLRLIGLPLDMPLELVLLDFSRVNYSSARASFLQFYQAMRPKQDYFRKKVLSRVYRWWVSRAAKAGEFVNPVPDFYWPHNFMPRGWQWVDPLKEAQAGLLEVGMGINTPRRLAARLGRDYNEITAELAADLAAHRAMGLPLALSTLTRDPTTPIDGTTAPAPYYDDEENAANPADDVTGTGDQPNEQP